MAFKTGLLLDHHFTFLFHLSSMVLSTINTYVCVCCKNGSGKSTNRAQIYKHKFHARFICMALILPRLLIVHVDCSMHIFANALLLLSKTDAALKPYIKVYRVCTANKQQKKEKKCVVIEALRWEWDTCQCQVECMCTLHMETISDNTFHLKERASVCACKFV